VLFAGCGVESARPGQASDLPGDVTSSALASDAETNSDPVSANSGAGLTTPAPSDVLSTRPSLERRATASVQVVGDPLTRGADADTNTRTDDDSGTDARTGTADNDAQTGTDDEADDEPKVDPRVKTLAWLADESVSENFPAPTARTSGGGEVPRIVFPEEPLEFVRPEAVKGIYLNAWAAGSAARSQALIDLATRTEVNAFVIDLKDASGYVSYATQVMTAREAGADQEIRIRDLTALLERLQEAGIYPIARIVMVKDPLLIHAQREWAVQDTAGGVWVDGNGSLWANLHDQRVWDYHVDLAKEAAAVGFPEIQWDYIRFADAPPEHLLRATYPGADGRRRRDVVEGFLEYARAELEDSGVDVTLDVFGATTSSSTDIGIGQYWENFIGSVDVAQPMVYPSHYWEGSFGFKDPNGHPYEIVRAALVSAMQRSEAMGEAVGLTRPWLQDFTLGEPLYDAPEVRAQIQATYDAGIDEWLLWNAGSRYTEAALAPVGGYPEDVEPLMRVGGRIVPVSERYEAMAAEAEERALARAVAD
ncbi:uncharacterized protein METZ01_LOCUS23794, partial [marine metagenome]